MRASWTRESLRGRIRVSAIAPEVAGKMKLHLDRNQTMSFEEAVTTGARLEDSGIYLQYFERPLRTDNIGGYKRLRQRLRTAIGVNKDAHQDRTTSRSYARTRSMLLSSTRSQQVVSSPRRRTSGFTTPRVSLSFTTRTSV
jgi:hypothetical protein